MRHARFDRPSARMPSTGSTRSDSAAPSTAVATHRSPRSGCSPTTEALLLRPTSSNRAPVDATPTPPRLPARACGRSLRRSRGRSSRHHCALPGCGHSGHDDLRNRPAERRDDAGDQAGATGRRLHRSRRLRGWFARRAVARLGSRSVGSRWPAGVLPHCEDPTVRPGAVPRHPSQQSGRGTRTCPEFLAEQERGC